jgi:hypothetical protein
MRIQFNTGRGYSAVGQPITAVQRDHEVKFRDHARGITGTIYVARSVRPMNAHELQEFVMWNYDRNNYTDAHWTEDELEWREQ